MQALLGYFIVKYKHPAMLLISLLIMGLALRIIPSLDIHLHQWDECYHALVAKNISKNGIIPTLYPSTILPYDYTDWSSNYIWLHKPPFTLWLIAGSLKIFGYFAFSVRIPSILFSTITIYLVYRIGILISHKQFALFAAYLFCINGFLIDLCSGRTATDHVDTLFLFLVTFGIFLSLQDGLRNYKSYYLPVLIGIITGFAILTKWIVGIFIILIYGIVLIFYNKQTQIKKFKKLVLATACSLIISIPWNIFAYLTYPKEYLYEQLYNLAHISKSLEGHNKPYWYFIDQARINWNELIYLYVIYFVYLIYKKRNIDNIFILLWIAVPYLLFSLASTKMPAYVAICAPAIFLLISWSIFCTEYFRFKNFLIAITIGLGIRYSIERVKPFERFHQQKVIPEFAYSIYNIDRPIVLFGVEDHIQAMFFNDVIAYPRYPSKEEFEAIKGKNIQILGMDSPELPDYMRNDSSVVKYFPLHYFPKNRQ